MTHWDERYAETDFAYGTEPSAFLAAVACQIPDGPVLCLAEGQGRNAVFLARRGHAVTAVDQSAVGLGRARELAGAHGVTVECVAADLAHFEIEAGAWAGIVSIWAHLPPALRGAVYRRAVAGLRPGGVMVVEAYSPRQLEFGTGGPRAAELLVPRPALERELSGLEFILAQDAEREVVEGKYHRGMGAVVQVLGRKPAA
ncbi:MAG TPA: class I SAM-dependent methyltransferase [Gemmatimonadaceae bacterium]